MPPSPGTRLQCAIYTRKSSEEGLDQAFNSLDAQREACEAYIASQAGEGWRLVRTQYDDGGISGGTMERPALKQLLADIAAGRINVVVVYKVDRLTRSLADFARIVEILDARGVSFVSITQQFNTTSSMGRLTLNMLLSFAQFEREVTGERIRDKIAASKRKGMWMGGLVPLGYQASGRTLVINPAEAETIRTLFRLYLEHRNVTLVKMESDRLGLLTKPRTTPTGATIRTTPIGRGHIYRILGNPLYSGQIAHKGALFPAQHAAIIDKDTWDATQACLETNIRGQRGRPRTTEQSLLAGLVFDVGGNRLTPTHSVKRGRRYRYYTQVGGNQQDGDALRLPASALESAVLDVVGQLLADQRRIADLVDDRVSPDVLARLFRQARKVGGEVAEHSSAGRAFIRRAVQRVTVGETELSVAIPPTELLASIAGDDSLVNRAGEEPDEVLLTAPVRMLRRWGARKLVLQDVGRPPALASDPALLRALERAHRWLGLLTSGEANGTAEIAGREGLGRSYVVRVLRLAFLAPGIVQSLVQSRADASLRTLLAAADMPANWHQQADRLWPVTRLDS